MHNPEFLTALRTAITAELLRGDPSLTEATIAADSRMTETIDLAVNATVQALDSITLVADNAHCPDCGNAVKALALHMLGQMTIEVPSFVEITVINSPEELEAIFSKLGIGDEPPEPDPTKH